MSTKETYPIAVFEDRYCGVYSGGAWIAVAKADLSAHYSGWGPKSKSLEVGCRFNFAFDGTHDGDPEADEFGRGLQEIEWIAVGDTPQEAIDNLCKRATS